MNKQDRIFQVNSYGSFLKESDATRTWLHRHLVPELGITFLNCSIVCTLCSLCLYQHTWPYIKVRWVGIAVAERLQSLIEKISQIASTSRLDDIRRVGLCTVLLKDVMSLPVQFLKYWGHNLLQNLSLAVHAALIFTFFARNTSGSFPRLHTSPKPITDTAFWYLGMCIRDGRTWPTSVTTTDYFGHCVAVARWRVSRQWTRTHEQRAVKVILLREPCASRTACNRGPS